jgi:hypothetical protein
MQVRFRRTNKPGGVRLTHEEPDVWRAKATPDASELSFIIQAPDFSYTFESFGVQILLDDIASFSKPTTYKWADCDSNDENYPVQNMTTSARSSLPSANFKPVSVKLFSMESFFSLIFPSITY